MSTAVATEASLLDVLWHQYGSKMVNAVVPHAPLGYAPAEVGFTGLDKTTSIRFIDALVLFRAKRWAVECKVTPSDLRREIANPDKVQAWRAHTHAFYYLVPSGLADIALAEVPTGFGVMVPTGGHHFTQILRRSAINRDPLDLPYDTWRRISRRYGELKLRGSR